MELPQKFEFKKEQYSHIELTDAEKVTAIYKAQKDKLRTENTDLLSEEEIEEVYRIARSRKDGELKSQSYMRVVREVKPVEPITALQLYDKLLKYLATNTGKSVNLYDGRDKLYMDLCKYFAKEQGIYDINRSLWLEGGVGVGKTTLMKFFQQNSIDKFTLLGARELGYQFLNKDIGVKVIERYSKKSNGVGICIDDVGTETALKSFGNELNVVGEIIVNCYDNGVFPAHITTNLTLDQFKVNYGERAFDRLKENYNQVLFSGKSLR